MSTTTDTTDSVALRASRPLPDWLKGALLAGCIFFACWAGTIAWWRVTRSAPDSGELALYLLGVPSLLVLALFVGQRLLGQGATAPAAPARAASIQDSVAAPAPTAALAVLAAAVRSAHGASPEELAAMLAAGTARADLDPELVDEAGFPIMSVRSPDAGDDALQDEIADWLAHHGMPGLDVDDEQWRALVLGSAVVEELASHAVSRLLLEDGKPPLLGLAPLLPPDWSPDQRQAAAMWFAHLVERAGWPTARIAVAAEAAPKLPAAVPSVVLERLGRDAAGGAQIAALLVACASHLGDDSVARWSADGSLFTSTHPQGWIPGEGAAGLLLTDLQQARAIADAHFAVLEPLQESRRTISADATRRADASALGEAAERALARHGNADGAVTRIVADTGHRSSRVIELMGFMVGSMPQLDEVDDAVRVGEACGACAAVPFITALAVASHYALGEEGPVLCISNEDPYRRSAALLQAGSALS